MKNNNYLLDTSFICSLINRSDDNYQNALKLFDSLPKNSYFYIPQTVNLELSIFLSRHPEFKQSVDKLYILITPEYIDIDNTFILQFKKYCSVTRLGLKPIDYSVLFCSNSNKFNLLSFDKKLFAALNKS